MHNGDDPIAVAKKTYVITMIGIVLYVGAVFAFILR